MELTRKRQLMKRGAYEIYCRTIQTAADSTKHLAITLKYFHVSNNISDNCQSMTNILRKILRFISPQKYDRFYDWHDANLTKKFQHSAKFKVLNNYAECKHNNYGD